MRFFRVRKVAARSRVKLCLLVLISERRECERERKTSFSRNYDASSLEEEEEEEAVVVGSIFPMRLWDELSIDFSEIRLEEEEEEEAVVVVVGSIDVPHEALG